MNIPLANRLSALRRESNLSENDLAAFINVTAEKIISWERAESEPTASELFELSKLYHISIDELIRSEQFDASEPISLKKDRPSVSLSEPISSSGFVREKAPDKPADHEIYPEGYKGAAVNHGGYGVPVNPGGNSGTANSGGYGGIQFIGADSERFQNAPYVKADDIKPRDFSHIAYDEPQNQNIKIKTVNASGENSGGNPGGSVNLDFGG
ncbi:MAG: helix-turn-helix domain-containing protein, partial [Ruminococcus sp.]|nr:helix-turn-helix domain-containing protein [Ruminococcus sp.]